MINNIKKGSGSIPTKTETVSVSVTTNASAKEGIATFSSLDEVQGITAITSSGDGMFVNSIEHGFWNCLLFKARRSKSSSTTGTYTITGYQGQVSKNKVESNTVTLNATSITVPFTHTIKCIRSISGVSSNRGWVIYDATVSGNNIVLRCNVEDGSAQTCVIETYY